MCLGGKSFADKHRIEIRNKRRGPNETLQSLHIEIRRLAALAFPTMEHRTREVISCDYFLHALADPDFALKIRERHPEDLDSALHIALQLEVWTKDSQRLCEATIREQNKEVRFHNSEAKEPRKLREVTKSKSTLENNDKLKKEIEDQKRKITELEGRLNRVPTPRPPFNMQFPNKARTNGSPAVVCFKCGKPSHMAKECFARVSGNQNGFVPGYPPKGPSPAGFANNGCVSNGQFVPGLVQNMQNPPHFVPNGQGAYGVGLAGQYPLGYGPNGSLPNGQTSSQVSPPRTNEQCSTNSRETS